MTLWFVLMFLVPIPSLTAQYPPPVRAKLELVMGQLPGSERKVPLDVKVTEETKFDGYTRKKLSFGRKKGDSVIYSHLTVPEQSRRSTPLLPRPSPRSHAR